MSSDWCVKMVFRVNTLCLCEIGDSHSVVVEGSGLLGCDAVCRDFRRFVTPKKT